MKKTIAILLVLVMIASCAFAAAQGKTKQLKSVSGFTLEYPSDLMKVVSDDENVILVSKNEKQTTTVCIVMEEELSADPVARLIALDEYHQHEESEIEVFETRGNGKAYRLRDISGDNVRDQYVVREGDREFTVDVMLDLKLLEKYDDILRELVLSMALVQ